MNPHHGAAFRLLGLGLSLLSAGCGAAISGALTPPEAGGAPWVEASSPHFVVSSDLPAGEATSIAEELERIYSALSDLGFPYEAKPPERLRVVVFERELDYQAIAPRGTPGFISEGWIGGEADEPLAVLSGDLSVKTRRVLQYELTQRFVRFYFPKAPPWLSEGLAHYFETMAVENGQAILGRPVFDFRKGLIWEYSVVATSQNTGYGMFAYRAGSRSQYGQIPTGQVPPARTVIGLDRGGFLPDPRASGSKHAELTDHQRLLLNQAGAWGLVHLMRNGPERYRQRFEQLLSLLGQGKPFSAAWDAVFNAGRDSASAGPSKPEELDQLDRDLLDWLVRPNREVVTLRTAYTPKPVRVEAPRAMSAAEVHLLWSGLRPQMLESEIEAAVRADPEHPAVRRAQARLLLRKGQRDQAEALLKQALKRRPEDPQLLFALFEVYEGAEAVKDAPPQWRERAETMVPTLLPHASTAYRQNELASALARWGRADEALPLAERSIQTDASCWACYDTLALLLAQKGALDQAALVQSFAVNLMPERVSAPDVLRRLKEYQAAAAKAAPAGAPSPQSPSDPQAAAPGLSDSVVRTIVHRRTAGYDRCFAAGLSRDPKLTGKVIVRFVVEKDGAVSSAKDEGSTLTEKGVIECVLGEIRQLRFPAREGGAAAEVVYPVLFNLPEAAGEDAEPEKNKKK